MTEVLTESFCERCGTRYELAPAQRSRAPGGLKQAKVFARGLTKYVLSDAALDEAFTGARREDELTRADAQLQVFHRTFSFCLECRQYTCPQCWNEVQSLCLTCAPMPERADSDPLALLEESADPGPGHAPPPREIVGASAWPMIDLVVANNPFPSPGESPQPIQALPFEPVFEPVFEPLRPDPEGIVALFIEPEHEQHADLHLVPAATDDPAPTEDPAFTDDRVEMSAQADPAPADALASADGLARTDDLALGGFAVAGDPARIVAASDPTDDFAPVADPADNLVPVAELTVEAEPIADTPSNGNGRLIALRDWIERVSRRPTGAPTAAEATSADSGADRQPAVALADEPVAAGELADETVAVPVMPAGGRPRPVRKRVRPSARRARTVSMQTAPEPVVEPVVEPALELAPEPVVEPALELAPEPVVEPALELAPEPVRPWQMVAPDLPAAAQPVVWPPNAPVYHPPAPVDPWGHAPAAPTRQPVGQPAWAAVPAPSVWEASARGVIARPGSGVRPCGSCGLALSATARFCRRCGTRQA